MEITAAQQAVVAIMQDTYGHRIENIRVSGEWVVADATKSGQTMAKFNDRFRDAVRKAGAVMFARDGRVGFKLV